MLAKQLTTARDLGQAVEATRQALAKGGIATADGEKVLVKTLGPASSTVALPIETVHLAMEARHRASAGRLTLAELGEMLRDLGWPFGAGSTPGAQLVEFLKVWVAEAREDPKDDHSFVPLFLADMAARQRPVVDLGSGGYDPADLRLTLLELHLIAAAFDRALVRETVGFRIPRLGLVNVAYAQPDPCSQIKEMVGKSYGDLSKAGTEAGTVAVNEVVSKGLQEGVNALGLDGEKFGDAMSALGIAARLWKLVMLYSSAQVEVIVESDNPLHKPLKGEEPKYSAFTARAGVSDDDWRDYQKTFQSSDVHRGIGDCLGSLGLPIPVDLGDIGKDAANWRVEWRLPEGSPEHAVISTRPNTFSHAGQLQMPLTKSGDYSATATLVVDITPENTQAHSGAEEEAHVTARVELETSAPPSLGTLVNAVKGGIPAPGIGPILAIADALAEVCAGWFQEMVQPKAYATLTVTYHQPRGWAGTVTYTQRLQHVDDFNVPVEDIGIMPWMDGWTGKNTVEVRFNFGGPGAGTWVGKATLTDESECFNAESSLAGHGQAELRLYNERTKAAWNPLVGEPTPGVEVTIKPDSTYALRMRSDPMVGLTTGTKFARSSPCRAPRPFKYEESQTLEYHVEGRLDPKNPNVISGSRQIADKGGGITVTWNLSRH